MNKKEFFVIDRFNCNGKRMVTILIDGSAACVMEEWELNALNYADYVMVA